MHVAVSQPLTDLSRPERGTASFLALIVNRATGREGPPPSSSSSSDEEKSAIDQSADMDSAEAAVVTCGAAVSPAGEADNLGESLSLRDDSESVATALRGVSSSPRGCDKLDAVVGWSRSRDADVDDTLVCDKDLSLVAICEARFRACYWQIYLSLANM